MVSLPRDAPSGRSLGQPVSKRPSQLTERPSQLLARLANYIITIHYEKLPFQDNQLILDQWEFDYDKNSWDTIAPIKTGPSNTVPFAHLLPKNKDTSRSRQIVSYAKHPLRLITSVAQRAIMFIISTLPKTHFNVPKTQDYLDQMLAFETQLKFENNDVEFIPFSLDIKEMFTGLPHRAIERAIDWLLAHARTCTRSRFVRVPRDKVDRCSYGSSTNLYEVHQISFSQIKEVVKYDLQQAIFTVGKILMRQKEGAPIGGVLSTAMAIATCVFSECTFMLTLGADAKFLRVIRYVDDITGIVVILRNDPLSLVKARLLIAKLQSQCYPKQLLLKPEPIKNGEFRYLETLTTVQGNSISIRHYSKNIDSLRRDGMQKIFTIQHAHSFSPWRSKLELQFHD